MLLTAFLALFVAIFVPWYLKYDSRCKAIQELSEQGWRLELESDEEFLEKRASSLFEHLKYEIVGADRFRKVVSASCPFDAKSLGPIECLFGLEELDLGYTEVKDLDLMPLTQLKSVKSLNISETTIDDLSPIAKMQSIEKLKANKLAPKAMDTIGKLKNLRELSLEYCEATDIAALGGLLKLETIDLDLTNIEDLSPLNGLPNLRKISNCYGLAKIAPSNLNQLEEFHAYDSQMQDVSGLATCPKLKSVRLFGSRIENLKWATNLKNLEYLDIDDTEISDLSPLKGKINLRVASNKGTQVRDLSPLAGNLGIGNFETSQVVENIDAIGTWPELYELKIDSPNVTHFPTLATTYISSIELRCPKLDDLGNLSGGPGIRTVQLDSLPLEDIEFLRNKEVTSLTLKHMQVSDLSPLSGSYLKSLTLVDLPLTNLDGPSLEDLEKLTLVDIQVTDFPQLDECDELKELQISDFPEIHLETLSRLQLEKLALHNSNLQDNTLSLPDTIEHLKLNDCLIGDFSKLKNLTRLRYASFKNSGVTDLKWLKSSDLRVVDLSSNPIKDISPLGPRLIGINLSHTQPVDLSPLIGTRAENQGVIFLRHTQGYHLSPLKHLEWIVELDLSYSDTTELGQLKGIRINTLDLSHTPILSLESLSGIDIDNLIVHHTAISDLTPFKASGRKHQLFNLDISHTKVRDLTPLFGAPFLKSLRIEGLDIPESQLDELRANLPPHCRIIREASKPLDFEDTTSYYID